MNGWEETKVKGDNYDWMLYDIEDATGRGIYIQLRKRKWYPRTRVEMVRPIWSVFLG
jgi:hypothetical protein